MRSFISLAALLVKVNAMIRYGSKPIVEQIHYLVCEDAGFAGTGTSYDK